MAKNTKNGTVRSRTEWERIVKRYERSGLTQEGFCEREKLSLTTFTRWLQRVRQAAPGRFIEIPAEQPKTQGVALEFEIDGLLVRVRRS